MTVQSMGDNLPYSQNITNMEPGTTFYAKKNYSLLLSTPMGVDFVEISFDMDVQPLASHNAA